MSIIRRVKRGDTMAITATKLDSSGAPVNLTGQTVASKMRRGAAEVTLSAAVTNPAQGVVTLSATATAAAQWTPGLWSCDVQFTAGSDVSSSETFHIEVVEDVTF